MSTTVLSRQITVLRDALGIIEAQLASGQSSQEAMEDFKVAVDNVRNTTIAIVTANRADDYGQAIGRFHIQRATELAESVVNDAVVGSVTYYSEAWIEFRGRANDLLQRLNHSGRNSRAVAAKN